jgi:hypothetical protein
MKKLATAIAALTIASSSAVEAHAQDGGHLAIVMDGGLSPALAIKAARSLDASFAYGDRISVISTSGRYLDLAFNHRLGLHPTDVGAIIAHALSLEAGAAPGDVLTSVQDLDLDCGAEATTIVILSDLTGAVSRADDGGLEAFPVGAGSLEGCHLHWAVDRSAWSGDWSGLRTILGVISEYWGASHALSR